MIDVQTNNGIATVTINHGKANALDIGLCDALAGCFAELRRSDARAVIITGRGRIFSAGVDLLQVTAGGADYVRKFLPRLHRLYDSVFFHPRPVVAAINGHAIAGGCVLACCADSRIMARGGGRIGVTELLVGVPFPALAFEIMRFAVPRRHLPELTFGGATYDVDAALARGCLDDAVDADALPKRALAVAHNLAAPVTGSLCADQEAAPPGRRGPYRAQRRYHRRRGYRYLDAGAARRPRLRCPHTQQRLTLCACGLPRLWSHFQQSRFVPDDRAAWLSCAARRDRWSTIRKSGNRFSEKDHAPTKDLDHDPINLIGS